MSDKFENLARYNLEDSKGQLYYTNPFDTRKPRLTLKHLNKMKKFKAMHNLEMLKREEILTTMYGAPEEEGGMGGGMGGGGGDLF